MNKAPVFQHRHYKTLVSMIAANMADWPGKDDFIRHCAEMFEKDNPRFDRARFLAAASGQPSNGRDRIGPFAAGLMAATNGKVRS